MSNPALPERIATLTEIDKRYAPLYEIVPAGDGLGRRLGAAGSLLNRYRASAAIDPVRPYVYRTGPKPQLNRPEWMILIGCTTPGQERGDFLAAAAMKHIVVRD
jgi:hypothetical protein